MPKLRERRLASSKWDSYQLAFSDDELDETVSDINAINYRNSWCPKCTTNDDKKLKRLPKDKIFCSKHSTAAQSHYPCCVENCSRVFRSQDCLDRHNLWHQGKKPFKCDQCSQGFSSLYALKEHELKHANSKPLGCPFCDRFFRHYSSLIRHKKTHFGKLAKTYACHVCDKSFTLSSYLKSHSLVHTQERKYQCQQCFKKFLHPSDLKRHAKKHSTIKVHCMICKENFIDTETLKKHLQDQHCEEINQETETPIVNNNSVITRDAVPIHDALILTLTEKLSETFTETNLINTQPIEENQINKPQEKNIFPTLGMPDFDKVINFDFLQSDIDYAKFPNFKSQAYFDWLSSFANLCDILVPPIENQLVNKITQVHKTLVDEVSGQIGMVNCKDNFVSLLNVVNVLQKTINGHLKYIVQNL